MSTKIHVTKKLEKLVKKVIVTNQVEDCGVLGKWNATVFYVDRKKCWLVTNGLTKYNVILTDVKAGELKKIDEIFKDAFYGQLVYDGIITDFKNLEQIIGPVAIKPTDNDRSTTGFQNNYLSTLEEWKEEFGSLERMPIKDLTNRLNTIPIHLGKSKSASSFTYALCEMKKIFPD